MKNDIINMSVLLTYKFDALIKYPTKNKQFYSKVYTEKLINYKCSEKLKKKKKRAVMENEPRILLSNLHHLCSTFYYSSLRG